jgi:hypothetical protein
MVPQRGQVPLKGAKVNPAKRDFASINPLLFICAICVIVVKNIETTDDTDYTEYGVSSMKIFLKSHNLLLSNNLSKQNIIFFLDNA